MDAKIPHFEPDHFGRDMSHHDPAPQHGHGTGHSNYPHNTPEAARLREVQASRFKSSPVFAAIDLGTNNCRLIVAEANFTARRFVGYHVLDSFSRIVRLGAGLSHHGVLSESAMQRTLQALTICAEKIARVPVTSARFVATEACRMAHNGAGFVDEICALTGLKLEIIDRENEAKLAALGCAELSDPSAKSVLVFDIGGGSTELIWLHRRVPKSSTPDESDEQDLSPYDLSMLGGAHHDFGLQGINKYEIGSWISLPVGVVSLAERYGGHVVDDKIYLAQVEEVYSLLRPFMKDTGDLVHLPHFHLLGASGTVTTLAGVHLGLRRYERRYVDGLWMTQKQILQAIGEIRAMDYAARIHNGCIGSDRADLVLAGCAIYEAIQRAFPSRFVRVADRGLREGILAQLLSEHSGGKFAERAAMEGNAYARRS